MRREGECSLFGRPRRRDDCPSYANRVEAASDAGNPSNGSDDAAPAGSGLFVLRTGDTMSWQGSSSRGEKRLTKYETTRPKPQTLLPIPQAAITHEDLRRMGRGICVPRRGKLPRPLLGIILCGANYGTDILFLAQSATDRAGVNVQQLSCAQPIAPCLLKDSADDGVVQILHASAESERDGKSRLDFHGHSLAGGSDGLGR